MKKILILATIFSMFTSSHAAQFGVIYRQEIPKKALLIIGLEERLIGWNSLYEDSFQPLISLPPPSIDVVFTLERQKTLLEQLKQQLESSGASLDGLNLCCQSLEVCTKQIEELKLEKAQQVMRLGEQLTKWRGSLRCLARYVFPGNNCREVIYALTHLKTHIEELNKKPESSKASLKVLEICQKAEEFLQQTDGGSNLGPPSLNNEYTLELYDH